MINFVHVCGAIVSCQKDFFVLQCPSGFFFCRFSGGNVPEFFQILEIFGHLENLENEEIENICSCIVCVDDFEIL